MIYALNTRDISDHERRQVARNMRDDKHDILSRDIKVVHVCGTEKGKPNYLCVYCLEPVHRWHKLDQNSFHHAKDEGCHGSDLGLPGIENPIGVTISCPSDEQSLMT